MTLQDWAWGWIVWLRNRLFTDESRISTLEVKVKKMSDILDTLKADFEAYKTLVDETLAKLQANIAALTAGQLDPVKAAAIDDEINAARQALLPSAGS